MLILDLILIGSLIYGIIKGFQNGFLAELAALLSFFVATYIALLISGQIKILLQEHTDWFNSTITIVAFGLPFIAVIAGVSFIVAFFNRIFSMAGLTPINKVAGAFIGLFKNALIVSIALNLFYNINLGGFFASEQELDQSIFFNPIRLFGSAIYPMFEQWYLR